MSQSTYVITIDGPAASGKTSVSRDLANTMGWKWVSTGSFYRGLACVAIKEKVDLDNPKKLVELAQSNVWSVEMTPMETSVLYRGQRVTPETMQEEIGMYASQISQYPEVRQALLPLQRACASNQQVLVAEGRDCGTVVFPQALLKIYLTANSESRALRRSLEHSGSFEVFKDLQAKRDSTDASRAHAPMQVPEGGEVVDSSTMPREAVVKRVSELVLLALKTQNLTHLIKTP
jgi:cytidylate kinase